MKIFAFTLLFVLSITQLSFAYDFEAKWIWKQQAERLPYNQTILAKKAVNLGHFDNVIIRITADSYYRLFLNDKWVGDGPCRSYAAHFRYDEINVTPYLKEGTNEIKIISNFFGVGVAYPSGYRSRIVGTIGCGKQGANCKNDWNRCHLGYCRAQNMEVKHTKNKPEYGAF